MSRPFAAPDRSQQATTAGRIRRKPRKFRDKFESMARPEKHLYNNELMVAEGTGFEPSVHLCVPRFLLSFFNTLETEKTLTGADFRLDFHSQQSGTVSSRKDGLPPWPVPPRRSDIRGLGQWERRATGAVLEPWRP